MAEYRASFDAEIAFSNGGDLAVHGSRVDVPGPDIDEAGSERWFEELAALADGNDAGFADACRRHGIEFHLDSPWIPLLKGRYGLS